MVGRKGMWIAATVPWLLFASTLAVSGERRAELRKYPVSTQDKSLKILDSRTLDECYMALQSGRRFPTHETVRAQPGKALVLVEFEADFPKGPGWDLSAFFLFDRQRQQSMISSLGFAQGGPKWKRRFYRTQHGAGGLIVGQDVLILDNPIKAPGHLYFDLGQDGKLLWGGGRAAVRLVFEVPEDSGELELLGAQKITVVPSGGARVPTRKPGDRTAAPSPQKKPTGFPPKSGELHGGREVRIRNPNDFTVKVALRSAGKGKDFTVEPSGSASVLVPDGRYDIFFQYSSEPDALYQGDSFTLRGNGVEIHLVRVPHGNYGIRRVK